MKATKKYLLQKQSGFSLIEILVGLVIGLLTTLAITQVVTVFEGQKRSTTGTSEAQINGNVAVFTMQKDLQMAGYGMPIFDVKNSSLKCSNNPTIDHDNNLATPAIGLFPITINDGGNAPGASDTVRARVGNTLSAGAINTIKGVSGLELTVETTMACNNQDTLLVSKGADCFMAKVDDNNLTTDTTHITLKSTANAAIGNAASCLGVWTEYVYAVQNNQLTKAGDITAGVPNATPVPIVADVVNIQAQYGVSATADNNTIAQWVNPVGIWAAPTLANRNRIKAVRVAIVVRNGQLEKGIVTNPCTTNQGTNNNGPCAWDDTGINGAAPQINLANDADWQRYRYRVYDTIIPLRNIVWSRKALL